MERTKTKNVLQQVEVDATPQSPVGSVSVRTSPDVTPGGDHMASFYAKQVEDVDKNVELFAAIRITISPRK